MRHQLFNVTIHRVEDNDFADVKIIALDDMEARAGAIAYDDQMWRDNLPDDPTDEVYPVPDVAYCEIKRICTIDVIGNEVKWPRPKPIEVKRVDVLLVRGREVLDCVPTASETHAGQAGPQGE